MTDKLRAALAWIADIADKAYEQDPKLRAEGARNLKRISDRAHAALGTTPKQTNQETT